MAADKFEAAWKAAQQEALNDLPIALAQWQQGQNPDNATVLKRLELLLSTDNNGLDEVTKATLEAHAESLRPKLNWSKPMISRMYQVVEMSDPDEPTKAMLKEIQKDLLKGKAPSSSNRGRKVGSTSGETIPGAAKALKTTCLICGTEASPKAQTEHDKASLALQYAASSPTSAQTMANRIRVHFRDVHNQNEYNTKELEGAIKAIAIDPEAATVLTNKTEPKVRTLKFEAIGRPDGTGPQTSSETASEASPTILEGTDQTAADAAAAMAAANA